LDVSKAIDKAGGASPREQAELLRGKAAAILAAERGWNVAITYVSKKSEA
jgi:hypothetical protein